MIRWRAPSEVVASVAGRVLAGRLHVCGGLPATAVRTWLTPARRLAAFARAAGAGIVREMGHGRDAIG